MVCVSLFGRDKVSARCTFHDGAECPNDIFLVFFYIVPTIEFMSKLENKKGQNKFVSNLEFISNISCVRIWRLGWIRLRFKSNSDSDSDSNLVRQNHCDLDAV
jgi:hypothetical protein